MEEVVFKKDELFTIWVNDYTDKMYSWALFKTSNKEIAEDLVQETFLSAYNSMEKFQGKSSPLTWLQSILNHKILDYYKSKTYDFEKNSSSKKVINITDSLFNEDDGWKEYNNDVLSQNQHLLDDEEFTGALENCYNELPENWRFAIKSKYIFNLDSNEICQNLSITPSNYWKMIQRAKLMLKKCLELNWFQYE